MILPAHTPCSSSSALYFLASPFAFGVLWLLHVRPLVGNVGVDEGPHRGIGGVTLQEASPQLHHNTLCARRPFPLMVFSPTLLMFADSYTTDLYILALAVIGSILLYPAGGLAYIDALFFASGAATQSGLNT